VRVRVKSESAFSEQKGWKKRRKIVENDSVITEEKGEGGREGGREGGVSCLFPFLCLNHPSMCISTERNKGKKQI